MSDIYNCNWKDCVFEGTRTTGIPHVIIQHAPFNQVPFHCTLCGFRGTSEKALVKHVKTYKNHILLTEQLDDKADINQYLNRSKCVYNATWGFETADLVQKQDSTENNEADHNHALQIMVDERESELFSETVVVEVAEMATQTEKNLEEKLRKDLEKLKEEHKKELNKLADHLSRVQRRLRNKEDEVVELREEIKTKDPYVQGFNEMWEDQCKENDKKRHNGRREEWRREKIGKENFEPAAKRFKSIVKKLF